MATRLSARSWPNSRGQRSNAHVQLQGAAGVGLVILNLKYLTLVRNLMQTAPVGCNM